MFSKVSVSRVFSVLLVVLLLSGSVIGVTPAHAAGFVVTKTADTADGTCDADCSLREAIIAANAAAGNDTITVPAGTYTLTIAGTGEDAAATGDLDLTSNITINGAGTGSTIIQAGTLGVGGPPNGIDRVFHITGAFTVNISGVTVRNGNTPAWNSGGGIYQHGGSTLTITNSAFSSNSAYYGGGIQTYGALTITHSAFSNNSASVGGGIYQYGGTLTITNSAFSDNSASSYGGGIYSTSSSDMLITITNSAFSGNSALYGGGIDNDCSACTLTITDSAFFGNSANYGGGIYNYGSLTVMNSAFSDNSATAYGGGIDNYDTLTITNSAFSGNSAVTGGGGVNNNAGTAAITNSTFSGNSASVSNGGGISNNISSTATLRNTIVANSASGGNCNGTITNGSNNIDDGTTCGWGSASGSMSSADPLLGALADNGGPTQTFALLAGSPAIDGVTFSPPNSAPSTDQRGVARPQGARFDIGSFEYDITPPDTTIDSAPPNPSNDNTPIFAFSGDDGMGSGIGIASFMCQMDSGGYSTCVSPFTSLPLADGSHTFYVYAIDNAGNLDASPASFTWQVVSLYRIYLPLVVR